MFQFSKTSCNLDFVSKRKLTLVFFLFESYFGKDLSGFCLKVMSESHAHFWMRGSRWAILKCPFSIYGVCDIKPNCWKNLWVVKEFYDNYHPFKKRLLHVNLLNLLLKIDQYCQLQIFYFQRQIFWNWIFKIWHHWNW